MLARNENETADAIGDYLRTRFPALASQPLTEATPLLDDAAIDSLGILELMTFLGERFGVEIADEDLDPENLETFGKLVRFVERKRS